MASEIPLSPPLCLPPTLLAIVLIVWVRRVMADSGLGQSLNRGWLLQGSAPSDAKAAWGLTGSQPHLNTETSFTQLLFTVKQLIKSSGPGFVWHIYLELFPSRNIRGVTNIQSGWGARYQLTQSVRQRDYKRSRIFDIKWNKEGLNLCKLTLHIKIYKSVRAVILCQRKGGIQSYWTWIKFACVTQRGSRPDVLSLLSRLRISVRNASTLHQSPLAIPDATLPQWPTYRQLRRSSTAQTSPWLPLSFPPLLPFLLNTCNCGVLFPSSLSGEQGKPCGFIGTEP